MRRRILTVGPTDVYLHLGTLLFGVYALLSGAWPMLLTAATSVLLHECAHAVAAALAGQPPLEIELTPLGAVMRLEDEARLPAFRRLMMLLAGPAMTLLLCLAALRLTQSGAIPISFGRMLFSANAAILLLNLLPALPLDGGRVVTLLLSCFLRQETVRHVTRAMGACIGLAVIGMSVWMGWRYGAWNLSLAMAGCFLMYTSSRATTTQALEQLRLLMDRKIILESRGYLPVKRVAILAGQPLHRAVRLLHPRAMTEFSLLEQGTMKIVGLLTEERLITCWLEAPQMKCSDAVV